MKIDKKTHILTKNNFINEKNEKKKIVLVNSFSRDMKFFNGWLLRRNKNYKKVTPLLLIETEPYTNTMIQSVTQPFLS